MFLDVNTRASAAMINMPAQNALRSFLKKNCAATIILTKMAWNMQEHQHKNAGREEKRKRSRAEEPEVAGEVRFGKLDCALPVLYPQTLQCAVCN